MVQSSPVAAYWPDGDPRPVSPTTSVNVKEETADIGMDLFDSADHLGIDLLEAMEEKLERDREKYPLEKAKDGSEKCDEL